MDPFPHFSILFITDRFLREYSDYDHFLLYLISLLDRLLSFTLGSVSELLFRRRFAVRRIGFRLYLLLPTFGTRGIFFRLFFLFCRFGGLIFLLEGPQGFTSRHFGTFCFEVCRTFTGLRLETRFFYFL